MYAEMLEEIKSGAVVTITVAGDNHEGVSQFDVERHLGRRLNVRVPITRDVSMAQGRAYDEWARRLPDSTIKNMVAATRAWNEKIGGRVTANDVGMVAVFAEHERRGL